jgi:hypothetical protein
MHKLTQIGNEFVNVFVLNVNIDKGRLIVCMQDYHCNLVVVLCDRIEQMLNGSVVFDESVEIVTEESLEEGAVFVERMGRSYE